MYFSHERIFPYPFSRGFLLMNAQWLSASLCVIGTTGEVNSHVHLAVYMYIMYYTYISSSFSVLASGVVFKDLITLTSSGVSSVSCMAVIPRRSLLGASVVSAPRGKASKNEEEELISAAPDRESAAR